MLITGIVPSESSIFKSALHPLRLTFKTANGGTWKIIFKKGDDLRQDQLVFLQKLLLTSCLYACKWISVCAMYMCEAHQKHIPAHVLLHTHKHYFMHLEIDVQETRVQLQKYLTFCRLSKWYH